MQENHVWILRQVFRRPFAREPVCLVRAPADAQCRIPQSALEVVPSPSVALTLPPRVNSRVHPVHPRVHPVCRVLVCVSVALAEGARRELT